MHVSSFKLQRMTTACCGKLYTAAGDRSWCSFCHDEKTHDIRCVEKFVETGDKMWLYMGKATEPVSDIPAPVLPPPPVKVVLTASVWLSRRDNKK